MTALPGRPSGEPPAHWNPAPVEDGPYDDDTDPVTDDRPPVRPEENRHDHD
jgi:hypothetical protein